MATKNIKDTRFVPQFQGGNGLWITISDGDTVNTLAKAKARIRKFRKNVGDIANPFRIQKITSSTVAIPVE